MGSGRSHTGDCRVRLTPTGTQRRVAVAEERRRTIVLWGAADSGKSGLIGALRSEGTKTVGERWTLDLTDASPDTVAYADSASLALRLRDVKETAIRRPERAFTVTVRRYAGRTLTAATDLTVLDPRGELAPEPSVPNARRTIDAVRTADGILWLLEAPIGGVMPASNRIAILRQVTAMLEAAGMTEIAVPVIIGLTKIDRLPQQEMNRLREAPEEALRAILGDAAFGWLLAAFPRLHCFAFSAAGTVRNAARPVGLTSILDWFTDEWRREEQAADTARTRARRSAQVAHVRRRAPLAVSVVAVASIIGFAGVAAARLLGQHGSTWSTAAGSVVTQGSTAPSPPHAVDSIARVDSTAHVGNAEIPSVASAVAALERGDPLRAVQALSALRLPDSSAQRYAADSVLAAAAMRGTEQLLNERTPATDSLLAIVSATSQAIARAHPGTAVLAPLSLARAGACIGGRLACPADQVREDLAWALLLGTPAEQDQARRLRAALVGDTVQLR
jgi:hypothetical protein